MLHDPETLTTYEEYAGVFAYEAGGISPDPSTPPPPNHTTTCDRTKEPPLGTRRRATYGPNMQLRTTGMYQVSTRGTGMDVDQEAREQTNPPGTPLDNGHKETVGHGDSD